MKLSIKSKSILWNLAWAAGLTTIIHFGNNLSPSIAYIVAINIVAFFTFAKDKQAAKKNKFRTPELTFLTLGFIGAWPAIFAGRKLFNHKTSKLAFVIPMWTLFIIELMFAFYFATSMSEPDLLPPPIFEDGKVVN